jgi:hypothetical protein
VSYREENEQVILTMSRQEFASLREVFRAAIIFRWPDTIWILRLENLLNEGNPKWKRYQVPYELSPAPDCTPSAPPREKGNL